MHINQALNNLVARLIAMETFFDVEGAFDNAIPDSIHEVARNRGIDTLICGGIEAML